MKRTPYSWLWVLALLMVGCKDCDAAPQPPAQSPQIEPRYIITVDGTIVRYNGQELPWSAKPDRWQQILGPRSRLVDGISVWDELGVFVYHQGKDPDATSPTGFEVLFGRTPHSPLTQTEPEFWPRKTFTGRLLVDGAAIDKSSTVNQANRDKKGESFARAHIATTYGYWLEDGYYVALDFGHDGSLKSFSIAVPAPD